MTGQSLLLVLAASAPQLLHEQLTDPPAENDDAHGKLPSLYPSYMPYNAQHIILTTVQQVLEECCFDFATTCIPSVLQKKQWDCPAAVELTQWTRLFRTGKGKLLHHTFPTKLGTTEAQRLLEAASELRHTAVHRLPTTAREISKLLESALKLAKVLGDDLRAAQLEELWSEVNGKIEAMELNKNVLEDTVSNELQKLQQKREELDKIEAEVMQGMLKDDMDNKALIGRLLEESVHGIFTKEEGMKQKDAEAKKDWENEVAEGESGVVDEVLGEGNEDGIQQETESSEH